MPSVLGIWGLGFGCMLALKNPKAVEAVLAPPSLLVSPTARR